MTAQSQPPRIEYLRPLERAWARTRLILFTPFDPAKWLGMAFAAWLAALAGGTGTSYTYRGRFPPRLDRDEFAQLWHHLTGAVPLPLLAGVGLVGLVLAVLLIWLSSRGKFVFLHDLVVDRPEIALPWKEYKREGDSLFWFRLALVAAVVVPAAAAVAVLSLAGDLLDVRLLSLPGTLAVTVVLLLLALAVVLAHLYTENFAVPIMYRFRMGALDAWRVLWRWIAHQPWPFLAYALFVAGLAIVVGAAIGVIGLLTCCIGFLILAVPYVGTVLTLPIWVVYRCLGPEFLAQFDPRFDVFAPAQDPVPAGHGQPPSSAPPELPRPGPPYG